MRVNELSTVVLLLWSPERTKVFVCLGLPKISDIFCNCLLQYQRYCFLCLFQDQRYFLPSYTLRLEVFLVLVCFKIRDIYFAIVCLKIRDIIILCQIHYQIFLAYVGLKIRNIPRQGLSKDEKNLIRYIICLDLPQGEKYSLSLSDSRVGKFFAFV